jgi:N-acetylated-alpha-linked acidic dipeptidase
VGRYLCLTEANYISASSVPNNTIAHAAAKRLSADPHLAGSSQDLQDALWILEQFQSHLGIESPSVSPIFEAGSPQSRHATLSLTTDKAWKPSAWVDIYHPMLDTPLDRSLDLLDEYDVPVWSADLVEDGDPGDPDAHRHRDTIHAWHSYSAEGEAVGQVCRIDFIDAVTNKPTQAHIR